MRFVVACSVLFWGPVSVSLAQEARTSVDRDLELLRSDEIRDREAAERRLASLPADAAESLWRRASVNPDAEVRARVAEAIREISLREADRLLTGGYVQESLRWIAGAIGDRDGDELILRTKQTVAHDIRDLIPESPCTDDFPQDYAILATTIDHQFGAWGIAVLLDALANGESGIPAVALLQEMGDEILPCLARGLERGEQALKREICMVLYGMTFDHDRLLEDTCGLAAALAAVAEDPATDGPTQGQSRYALTRIRPRPCDDDPVTSTEAAP
jgi:hypothetical protein